jgi:CRP-like cAMP-binding protein
MDSVLPRTVSFLKNLTDEEHQSVSSLFQYQVVQPGQQIIAEGQPMHHFYIVCRGTVHVRRKAQKREVLLGRIPECGFFGEVNLFNEGSATASIYAMQMTTIAVVDNASFRAFMEENPAIGYKVAVALMSEVCTRLRATNDKLVNSVFWSSQK